MSEECTCTSAGYCERYGRHMPALLFHACKNNPKLRESMDDAAKQRKENPDYEEKKKIELTLVEPPTAIDKIKNFSKAVVKHVKDGLREVTEKEFEERLSICKACEYYKDGTCIHKDCGCILDIKCKWASEECPEKKWLRLEPQKKKSGCSACGS